MFPNFRLTCVILVFGFYFTIFYRLVSCFPFLSFYFVLSRVLFTFHISFTDCMYNNLRVFLFPPLHYKLIYYQVLKGIDHFL